jgi:hypothetical protein
MNTNWTKALCWAGSLFLALLATETLAQRSTSADTDPSSRVARLNYLRGSVSFQPAGDPDWVTANLNRPLTTGDSIWADEGARAELQLGSSAVRLTVHTSMSFLNLDDRTTQIELSEGVLNVRVLRLDRDEIFEVDTPNQAFSIMRPGQYRIEATEDGNTTMVTVRSGEGEVTGGGRTYAIGTGVTGSFTGSELLHANIYKAVAYDEFDSWCQDRDRRDDGAKSVRYVSREVVGYQDLDDYGIWQLEPGYGYVWTPKVSVGWAPYHDGHWVWISPWGWTWVDEAPWGYAPFHYGRWAIVRNSWAWIPGPIAVRPVYAPALVVFVASIGGGNVGWFPLGPREVFVPAYHTSREYVDRVNISSTAVTNATITSIYNNTRGTNIRYVNKTVRGAMTAVSQSSFSNAQPVGKSTIAISEHDLESAPVHRSAEVVPNRNGVLGRSVPTDSHVSQPGSEVLNRTVVAKTPPPAQAHIRLAPPGKPAVADSIQAFASPPASTASAGRRGNRR